MLLIAGAVILLAGFVLACFIGAPWLPVRRVDSEQILAKLNVKPGSCFVDLGCGAGGMLLLAAKQGAKVVGYEINPILWLVSKLRLHNYDAKLHLRSFWTADLKQADFVYVFLINHYMARLERKLKGSIKPGGVVVSYTFAMPTMKPSVKTKNTFYYQF